MFYREKLDEEKRQWLVQYETAQKQHEKELQLQKRELDDKKDLNRYKLELRAQELTDRCDYAKCEFELRVKELEDRRDARKHQTKHQTTVEMVKQGHQIR